MWFYILAIVLLPIAVAVLSYLIERSAVEVESEAPSDQESAEFRRAA